MSWNVKNLDLYNWTQNKATKHKIFELIYRTQPDILCLQEFFTNEGEHNNIYAIENLGYPYHYFVPAFKNGHSNSWGLVIFSKLPILRGKAIPIHDKKNKMNGCIEAIIKHKGRKLRILNAHLQSLHLDYEDYSYVQNVKREWKMWEFDKTMPLFRKLINAYVERENQINRIKKYTESSEDERMILCADMNDIPNSYAYTAISRNLKDAFVEKGRGFSNTTGFAAGFFRIDYIFASKDFEVLEYKRIRTKLSDHHPIYATLLESP